MMKKLLTVIITVAMMASLFIPHVSAADEQFVQVQEAAEGIITIDGVLNEGEWDEQNKLILSTSGNPGTTKMYNWVGDKMGDIQFYYSWNENGLYMAAKVIDSTFTPKTDMNNSRGGTDHFQIALNPMGLIAPEYQALFFSFCPYVIEEGADTGDVICVVHNWEQGLDDFGTDASTIINTGDLVDFGETYEGKYKVTENGWNLEILLPMEVIASEKRIFELDVSEDSAHSLTEFYPFQSEALAWASSTICYVDNATTTDAATGESKIDIVGAARTAFNANGAKDFTAASYSLVLKFNKSTQTPSEVTETVAPTPTTPETDPTVTDPTDPTVTDPTGTEGGDTTTAGGADTTTASTTAATTTDAADAEGEGSNVVLIVIIAVAAVAVVAAVVVVILKKKK